MKPTDAALKCAEALFGLSDESLTHAAAVDIDRQTDLPALTAVALAAQGVIDAGRPHGGVTLYQHPDGCECEQCEAWDTLKGALAKLHCQAESDCGTVAREILTEAMRNITP